MGNTYLNYFLFICFLLFAESSIFAQFSPDKIELIETTAKREFNKEILEKYFSSSDSTDVIAALLSASHSDDTLFVQRITNLDFKKYGKWISFALGQIKNSYSAKEFLWTKLNNANFEYSEFIFRALGNLADQTDLTQLIEFYYTNPELEGIEETILQLRSRDISNELSKRVLIKEFSNPKTSDERKKKILFTLARLGSDSKINNNLIEILSENSDNEMKQLTLMNFKVQKHFPINIELIYKIFLLSEDEVKIELIKCLPYSEDFNTVLKILSSILSDKYINENILVETLKSLQIQKRDSPLIDEFNIEERLKHLIQYHNKIFIKTEAIKTFSHLFGITELFKDTLLIKNLSEFNFIQLLVEEKKDLQFSTLLDLYENILVPKQKLNALEIILSLTKDFSLDTNFIRFIFNKLRSDDAAIISIIADGIDSSFIANNSKELMNIISYQAIRFKHNSDFLEAEISLIKLAKKITDNFQKELITKLSDSKIYSLRKYLKTFDNKIESINKNIQNVSGFIREAFNYSRALIKTNKGNIVVSFKSEYAPITVGNFIYLAKKNFYDGIIFHRVVPGFVIQAGDPNGTGWGGPGYEIISELSPLEFRTGAVGIASAGIDTEGSQFFIMQGYYPHLNSKYTLFAEVISGLEVVMKISEDDQIISIELLK